MPKGHRRLTPLAPGSLGRQLVPRFVAIIAAVSLALTATCLLALGRALEGQLDDQVRALANRAWVDPQEGSSVDGLRGTKGAFVIQVGREGHVNATVMSADGTTAHEIPDDVRRMILAGLHDGETRTVTIPRLGSYKVWISDRPPNGLPTPRQPLTVLAVGQPTTPMFAYLGTVAMIMGGFALAAILLSVVVVRTVMARALSPLTEVVSTADEISSMNLAQGDVEMHVDPPSSEEGTSLETERVAVAFNRMLEHVSGALIARQASETRVRQFVADASHELRNPLAAIRGYAEITRRERDSLSPDVGFAMARIDAESERMQRLVEDLLTLARLDADPALKLSPVDLTDLMVRVVSDARAADDGHTWRLDLPEQTVVATADEHRLQQVLINILTNARVHTPAGTTVVGRISHDGEQAVVEVSNDGPPIPTDKLATIFERFGRVDESRVRKGPGSTGLGLAIVRSVMEAHGGTCDVVSGDHETTFTLRLPLKAETSTAA